ncbi:MAG TPA: lysophospholipid acyltransferase family protein [Actinomycetota bacterium]|nr:lysophospholipid acyltransferase family protein [Actinomycetota bacterium]
MEPLFEVAKSVVLPPLKLWFNWRFEGLEHIPREGPVLVAGNHVSYIDQFAHGYFLVKAGRRPRFLAKAELFEVPVLGAVLRGMRQIPVRRGTGDPAPVERAVELLRAGEVVVVYPEATVTKNPDFTPMRGKTGVVRIALAAGVPVTPVATWGGQAVWQKSGPGSLAFGRPIWVKAGAPIDLSEHEGRRDDQDLLRELTDRVMDELAVLVEDLRSRYPKRWAWPPADG